MRLNNTENKQSLYTLWSYLELIDNYSVNLQIFCSINYKEWGISQQETVDQM